MRKLIALTTIVVLGTFTTFTRAEDKKDKDAQDKAFVVSAAQGGMTEVKAGEIALKNAYNEQVKKFAQQMIDDHTKANNELKQVAADKKLDIPSELDRVHQDKIAHLEKAKGEGFDKEYMKMMLGDHLETIALFKTETEEGNIHEVKKFAKDTLPTLEHHMDMAQRVNKEIGGEPITAGGHQIGTKDIIGKDKEDKK